MQEIIQNVSPLFWNTNKVSRELLLRKELEDPLSLAEAQITRITCSRDNSTWIVVKNAEGIGTIEGIAGVMRHPRFKYFLGWSYEA